MKNNRIICILFHLLVAVSFLFLNFLPNNTLANGKSDLGEEYFNPAEISPPESNISGNERFISSGKLEAQEGTGTANMIEYFIDTDPGVGNGIPLVSDSTESFVATPAIDISTLSEGIHTIYFRAQNSSGEWGPAYGKSFYAYRKQFTDSTNVPLSTVEYSIDNVSSFSPLAAITPGTTAEVTNDLDVSALSTPGIHSVYFRTRDENNHVSSVVAKSFYTYRKQFTDSTDVPLSAVEYSIDNVNSFSPVAAIASGTSATATNNFDVFALSTPGIHSVYFRTRDENNHVSSSVAKSFYTYRKLFTDSTDVPLSTVEYSIDNVSSFSPLAAITPGTTADVTNDLDVSALSTPGIHSVYFRTRDENNHISSAVAKSFFAYAKQKSDSAFVPLTSIEYTIDSIKGFIPLTEISGDTSATITTNVDISNVGGRGAHLFVVRAKDENNNFGNIISRDFNVENEEPVANAGADQTPDEKTLVTLDGSLSLDPNNDPLTFLWTPPVGLVLSSNTVEDPTFTAPEVTEDTTYLFTLVVNDGLLNSLADTVLITVQQVNNAPIANAGPDQVVKEDSLVTLDGSASSDFEGDQLTWLWTAPTIITLSSNTIEDPTFTAPEVTKDTTYLFTLVVNDGLLNSLAETVLITVSQVNKAPIANAGPDQTVKEDSLVTLDGSASSDFEGDPLTWLWSAPAGITLSSNTIVNPTFTAPEVTEDTTYLFTLVVNDGLLNSLADTVKVTVSLVNTPPVANAGEDQFVADNSLVQLDGSLSSDADLDPLNYHWTAPEEVTLSASNIANPTFQSPSILQDTVLKFTLIVDDGIENSIEDTVMIAVIHDVITMQNITRDAEESDCFNAFSNIVIAGGGTTVTLENGSRTTLIAGQSIRFMDGFNAQSGSYLLGKITEDASFCDEVIQAAAAQLLPELKEVHIEAQTETINSDFAEQRLKVFPNPNNGHFTIELEGYEGISVISIYNSLGGKISQMSTSQKTNIISDYTLRKGLYFVIVKNGMSIKTEKILVK